MFKSSTAAVAALALFSSSAEAKVSWGGCPNVQMMSDFDPARYSGKWYEIVRDRMNPMTLTADCVTKEFAPYDEGDDKMDLYFRGHYMGFGYRGATGALWECEDGSADSWTCKATMGGSSKRSPFGVFYTDYDNIEIYYSCEEWGWWKYESFALAARTPQITREALALATQVIDDKIPQYSISDSWTFYWTGQSPSVPCQYDWKFDE